MSKKTYQKDDFTVGKSLPVPPEQTPDQPDQPPKKFRRLKRISLSLVILFLAAAIVIGVWNARNLSAAAEKMFGTGNLLTLFNLDTPRTDNNGRVNLLVVGYSVDDPGHLGASLTDSIMLLSMDGKTDTGYMLSIPRDLYLRIPDNGYGKINQVYQDGGMELLTEVVEDRLGLDVTGWLITNYAAVRQMTDAVGGIAVNIQSSDRRGLYDPNISPAEGGPLQLPNGRQSLDGQTALNLTRARGATSGSYGFPRSDLTRIEHQKQVFAALKDKISSWKLVLNPTKNNQIFTTAAENVKTDITTDQALPLFRLFASIPTNQLKPYSLHNIDGQNLLVDGGGGLIPAAGLNNYSQIKEIIKDLN